MRIAMVTCQKYRDTWEPFASLFKKFWPDCPYKVWRVYDDPAYFRPEASWCEIVAEFARLSGDEPIFLILDDFLLNAPVNQSLVEHGLRLMDRASIGAVRLYPCPGATDPSDDPYFGPVARHSMYRNSTQVSIWRPSYLKAIAERFSSPWEFELHGSEWASAHLPAEVWAFKREVQPWPLSYECTAITKGAWTKSAVELCKREGIPVDLSLRPIEA